MTTIRTTLAAAAFVAAAVTPAFADQAISIAAPGEGATMAFADRYATAYYTVDQETFAVVLTVAPGPNGEGNPMRVVSRLDDGESATVSFGGFGENAILVTLTLTRTGDAVSAAVDTAVLAQRETSQS